MIAYLGVRSTRFLLYLSTRYMRFPSRFSVDLSELRLPQCPVNSGSHLIVKARRTREQVRTGTSHSAFTHMIHIQLPHHRLDDVRGGVDRQWTPELVDISDTRLRFHAESEYAYFPIIRPDFRRKSRRRKQVRVKRSTSVILALII